MNRGERRDINKRKWETKLKKLFSDGTRYFYKVKSSDWTDYKKAETWDDLKKSKTGVLYKKTGTLRHNFRSDNDDIKDIHKRDLANKELTKEDQEEIVETLENINYPYSFEKYCGACDHFGNIDECPFFSKVHDKTEWGKINCQNFFD